MKQNWTFSLPPSVGDRMQRAGWIRTVLTPLGCGSVRNALTYASLAEDLATGRVDVAWGPPLVCARMEALGGRVILRAVRGGMGTYRAAIFARADRALSMDALKGTRAAWLDQRSMAGYVLPRAMMRHHGLDPDTCFVRQKFLGSYSACVDAVLCGKVDLSSTYATSAIARTQHLGYAAIAGERASELVPLGFSLECPNDGIVLSPHLTLPEANGLVDAFQHLLSNAEATAALAKVLDVDSFEVPPPSSYLVLKEEALRSTDG